MGEEDLLSVLPRALSEINETRPYKSAYGHDIGHDMSCPFIYVIWRSDHLNKLAACCIYLCLEFIPGSIDGKYVPGL